MQLTRLLRPCSTTKQTRHLPRRIHQPIHQQLVQQMAHMTQHTQRRHNHHPVQLINHPLPTSKPTNTPKRRHKPVSTRRLRTLPSDIVQHKRHPNPHKPDHRRHVVHHHVRIKPKERTVPVRAIFCCMTAAAPNPAHRRRRRIHKPRHPLHKVRTSRNNAQKRKQPKHTVDRPTRRVRLMSMPMPATIRTMPILTMTMSITMLTMTMTMPIVMRTVPLLTISYFTGPTNTRKTHERVIRRQPSRQQQQPTKQLVRAPASQTPQQESCPC